MSDSRDSRRRFLGACSSLLGLVATSGLSWGAPTRPATAYERVLLTDHHGKALNCEALEPETEYVFHYPFATTPCFLFDLGRELPGGEHLQTEDGRDYTWRGGVGPRRSLVAFSAICAHRMTHPTPDVSFIGYRKQEVQFMDSDYEVTKRAGIIQCCSERSVYDPADGAKVLGGPAKQPLAAIDLEYTDDGELFARGVYGGELFDRFFETFGSRLVLEYQTLEVQRLIQSQTEVETMTAFTSRRVDCSNA